MCKIVLLLNEIKLFKKYIFVNRIVKGDDVIYKNKFFVCIYSIENFVFTFYLLVF